MGPCPAWRSEPAKATAVGMRSPARGRAPTVQQDESGVLVVCKGPVRHGAAGLRKRQRSACTARHEGGRLRCSGARAEVVGRALPSIAQRACESDSGRPVQPRMKVSSFCAAGQVVCGHDQRTSDSDRGERVASPPPPLRAVASAVMAAWPGAGGPRPPTPSPQRDDCVAPRRRLRSGSKRSALSQPLRRGSHVVEGPCPSGPAHRQRSPGPGRRRGRRDTGSMR